MSDARLLMLSDAANALARETTGAFHTVRVVSDDGRALLRAMMDDSLELRLIHRKARRRRRVVQVELDMAPSEMLERVTEDAWKLASLPPYVLHVDAYSRDEDEPDGEWLVTAVVDHESGRERVVTLSGRTRDQARLMQMALLEAASVLADLQLDVDEADA